MTFLSSLLFLSFSCFFFGSHGAAGILFGANVTLYCRSNIYGFLFPLLRFLILADIRFMLGYYPLSMDHTRTTNYIRMNMNYDSEEFPSYLTGSCMTHLIEKTKEKIKSISCCWTKETEPKILNTEPKRRFMRVSVFCFPSLYSFYVQLHFSP